MPYSIISSGCHYRTTEGLLFSTSIALFSVPCPTFVCNDACNLSHVRAVFQGVKLLVVATRSTDKSQSNVRSKLLFLGMLIAKGNEKAEQALEVRSRE